MTGITDLAGSAQPACRQIRQLLGVYIVGAIDPAERAYVDAHLADCRDCREELAGLAGLPALLGRVSLVDAERLSEDGHGLPDMDEPPAELLNSLLRRVAGRRRTRSKRRRRAASMSPAAASSAASSQSARSGSAATNGPYARVAPTSGTDSPIRTCTPPSPSLATAQSSSVSRVLPMPASPVIRSSWAWPPLARVNSASAVPRSAARPTPSATRSLPAGCRRCGGCTGAWRRRAAISRAPSRCTAAR